MPVTSDYEETKSQFLFHYKLQQLKDDLEVDREKPKGPLKRFLLKIYIKTTSIKVDVYSKLLFEDRPPYRTC